MLPLCLLLLTANPAPLKLAVPNFNVINVAPESAAFFMDRFSNRLRAKGLSVTSATEIETVLGLERQKSLMGCAETNCQAEIAAALGVDGIVRARIARFGARFELSLTLIDPANAAVLASVTSSAPDESKVLDALDEAADELSGKFKQAKRGTQVVVPTVTTQPPTGSSRWVALIPLAVGLGAGVAGGALLSDSFVKRDLIATDPDPDAVANAARVDRALGITLIGVGVAGLATAAILFFTAKEPTVTPVALLTHDGAWVGLEGRLP